MPSDPSNPIDEFRRQKSELDARGAVLDPEKQGLIALNRALRSARSERFGDWNKLDVERIRPGDESGAAFARKFRELSSKPDSLNRLWQDLESDRKELLGRRIQFDREQLSRMEHGLASQDASLTVELLDLIQERDVLIGKANDEYLTGWQSLIADEQDFVNRLAQWTRELMSASSPRVASLMNWRLRFEDYLEQRSGWLNRMRRRDDQVRQLDADYGDWRLRLKNWEPSPTAAGE